MICETDENRLLAENVLAILIKLVQEHVMSLEQRIAEVCCYTNTQQISTLIWKHLHDDKSWGSHFEIFNSE